MTNFFDISSSHFDINSSQYNYPSLDDDDVIINEDKVGLERLNETDKNIVINDIMPSYSKYRFNQSLQCRVHGSSLFSNFFSIEGIARQLRWDLDECKVYLCSEGEPLNEMTEDLRLDMTMIRITHKVGRTDEEFVEIRVYGKQDDVCGMFLSVTGSCVTVLDNLFNHGDYEKANAFFNVMKSYFIGMGQPVNTVIMRLVCKCKYSDFIQNVESYKHISNNGVHVIDGRLINDYQAKEYVISFDCLRDIIIDDKYVHNVLWNASSILVHINPNSRTVRLEVSIPNGERKIFKLSDKAYGKFIKKLDNISNSDQVVVEVHTNFVDTFTNFLINIGRFCKNVWRAFISSRLFRLNK